RRAAARGQQVSRLRRESRSPLRHRLAERRQGGADRVPENVLMPEDSNASRSAPRANTGSAFLDLLVNLSNSLVHRGRRSEPSLPPPPAPPLRPPVPRLSTGLIHMQRRNEGLRIAAERVR